MGLISDKLLITLTCLQKFINFYIPYIIIKKTQKIKKKKNVEQKTQTKN